MTPPPLLDRVLRRVGPRPVAAFAPQPAEIAAGVWGLDRQLRFPGGALLPSRTTIVRLSGGELVILSPPALHGTEGAAAIDSIGVVRYVVAPNTFHYTYVAGFMVCYPDATLLAAPGLPERVPELPPAEELGPGRPEAWSGQLDFAVLGPVRGLSEVVFFHVPSRSLILTDLAFNLTRFDRALDRAAWRVGAGIPHGFGPGRTSRSLLLRDPVEARRCLCRASEWPIERIVVAHGDVVEHDAKERFSKAFAAYLA
jgi:hypothetical protein